MFSEKVEQVNTSNHYSAQRADAGRRAALDLDAMRAFYRERFGNAADFTFFFVGAFTVDEITPLLEKWVASLPSTGKKTSAFRDMGVRFPARRSCEEEVKKGKEPASQTVMSFFADTGLDEFEMHRARAAASRARHPPARHPARGAGRHLRRQRRLRQLAAAAGLRRDGRCSSAATRRTSTS